MDMVKRFNAGEAQVFLISLKAGGTGLNLTGADVVIHYDPWWNTSAQNQATDRAYRIGQKRGVQVIKLIAGDTIEARILKLQESKMELSDGVLAGGENLYSIDAEELKKLLREDKTPRMPEMLRRTGCDWFIGFIWLCGGRTSWLLRAARRGA